MFSMPFQTIADSHGRLYGGTIFRMVLAKVLAKVRDPEEGLDQQTILEQQESLGQQEILEQKAGRAAGPAEATT